ncbi:MAG TPA: ESX secretion-associated protein EspG [Actinophytocola sp.]|jgi:hypothetical protein|nr:ESX secretion-associated protein EspG [Actinophytocola sp.]
MTGGTVRGGRGVELPVLALAGLLRRENLGDPHAIFAGGERYVSPRVAGAAEALLREELAGAGLGGRDALHDFLDTLSLVQRASAEFYGWVSSGDEDTALLVAATGRRAVAVVRNGDRVRFEPADPDRPAEGLVYRLPDVRAGAGDSVSVLDTEFRARGNREPGSIMRRSGSGRSDGARRLDALLKEPRAGGAKLYAAVRDRAGVRTRAAEWLTVLDLAGGRWVVYPTLGRGERAVNAVPATPQLLAAKLDELGRTIR